MTSCLFASDLHGQPDRYEKLFDAIEGMTPDFVFLGGDLLPHFGHLEATDHFLEEVIGRGFLRIKERMGDRYPAVLAILGNDDPRSEELTARRMEERAIWRYAHGRIIQISDHSVLGYACIPPSPFTNKDWEKYDVARYVPPGSVSPEEGYRTVEVAQRKIRHGTIAGDLRRIARTAGLGASILLFHTPPHETNLDRVANEGKSVDHVPLDLHVGSIAVRRFIEEQQPLLSLHGHIHESARLTGSWRDRIGKTHVFSAAHDGPELSLIAFRLEELDSAERTLL